MPTPQRSRPMQQPNLKVAHPPSSEILSLGVPVSELTEDYVHLLVYGRNGLGKTTLACQFPKPLALVSVEPRKLGGAKAIKRIPGVIQFTHERYVADCKRTRQNPLDQTLWVEEMGKQLLNDDSFQTVVVDSGTSLDEIVLAQVCNWTEIQVMNRFKKVSNDQYTERSERMRLILKPFFQLNKHFVLVCNEKDHNPQNQEDARRVVVPKEAQSGSFFAAAMGAGTTRWCQDGCNYVCQLYMAMETKKVTRKVGVGTRQRDITREEETGNWIRRLRLKYHPNFSARICSEFEDIPDYVEGQSSQEMYQNFMKVVNGEFKNE